MTAIIDLINEYMGAVDEALAMFERAFGRRDIIKAWREGAMPQNGELADGIEYEMHGIGCWVGLPNGEVDFDFAYNSDVGFDAFRLWSYAKQFHNRYAEYQGKDAVERALADAMEVGVVEPFGGYSNLLRLTEEARAR